MRPPCSSAARRSIKPRRPLCLEALEERAVPATSGVVDPAFGVSGVMHIDAPTANFSSIKITQLAAQDDGEVLAAGFVRLLDGTQEFAVFRVNPDGSPDSTFGTDGIATLKLDGIDANAPAFLGLQQPQSVFVAVDSATSDVIMAGEVPTIHTGPPAGLGADVAGHLVLARFHSDGSLDTDFGNGQGYVTGPTGSSTVGLALDQSTVIVNAIGYAVAGTAVSSPPAKVQAAFVPEPLPPSPPVSVGEHIFVAGATQVYRFNNDGTLDNSFAGSLPSTTLTPPAPNLQAVVQDIGVSFDGHVIVAGSFFDPKSGAVSGHQSFLVRYNADGTPDTSFGSNGVLTLANISVTRMVVQYDGSVFLTGSAPDAANAGQSDVALMHLNADGTADSSFGNGGTVTTALGNGNISGVNLISLFSDVIVSAASVDASGQTRAVALIAYHTGDGSLDSAFGNGGIAPLDLGNVTLPGLTSDWGDIIVGGFKQNADGSFSAVLAGLTAPPLDVEPIYALMGPLAAGRGTGLLVNHLPLFLRVPGNAPFHLQGANRISVTDQVKSRTPIRITLHVQHGLLLVKKSRGIHIHGNGTKTLQLTGTQLVINHLLASLIYRPQQGYHGKDVLKLTNGVPGRSISPVTSVMNIFVGLPQ